ncbi:ATP-binding protein [Lyngbya confervoides]|uniref:histidine kinase n=1 Tax=Lyngbya confervoides BDU141951 TaxID=1574623 RepID=A0ABD4T321_9CYAN|nr:ATP-binding protein [Lyngbya confervoides]MCM1982632.1 ATP-binding protein [Lyngbya confervoides BDU141951]
MNPTDTTPQHHYRHLLIIDDLDGRRTIILDAATYSIGRDKTNSIVLNSKMVSRQHAILLRVTSPENSTHFFRLIDGDLQGKRSTNGLLVNGRKLFSHDLKHGDTILFGNDVKAKYFLTNVTDSDFEQFSEDPNWSTFLSASQSPFETLIPSSDEQMEVASEASMVRLASFPELTPNPIMEIDLSGMVTYLNPAAVMQFPQISKEGTDHPILSDLLPATLETAGRSTHSNFFVREVAIGDKVFEQSVHYIAESDLIRSYVSDITERKRAEEQLRHQAQREAIINRIVQAMRGTMVTAEVLHITVGLLLEALDASHCMIVQTDLEGGLGNHFVSVTAEHREDLVLANDLFLQHFQDRLQAGQQIMLTHSEASLGLELIAVTQQCHIQLMLITPLLYLGQYLGSISLLQCSDTPHPTDLIQKRWNADDLGLVKTIADQCAIAIHQAQLYQQVQDLNTDLEQQVQDRTAQLEQKMLELERLNTLKDDFLSTVSHELRTPMSNIKMCIHMLNQFPLEDRQKRYLGILEQECQRETELINDLLDLQRLEAGANPAAMEPIDITQWLPKVLEPFKSRTRERQQILRVDCAPELSGFQSDRVGLERILAELLNNACKYTPQDHEICLKIDCLDMETATIRFQVTNEAEIPPAELPRVFDKFYRVPNADPWKQGGTGLGLALVKRLVEQLEGTIAVDSQSGLTTFTVELPCQPVMKAS